MSGFLFHAASPAAGHAVNCIRYTVSCHHWHDLRPEFHLHLKSVFKPPFSCRCRYHDTVRQAATDTTCLLQQFFTIVTLNQHIHALLYSHSKGNKRLTQRCEQGYKGLLIG